MKELQSLDDVFTKRLFRIPDYQRGYSWGKKQLIEFWEDLISLSSDRAHYTGVLSIKAVPVKEYEKWVDEKWLIGGRKYKPYYVVDGQQRLTTISIFIQCLIEAVRAEKENKGLADADIFLGSFSLTEIIEDYIVVTEPKHKTINTYKFGYETDNPSFDYLRHHIFNQENSGTLKETFYTLNLENSKKFFKENIHVLLAENGSEVLEDIYKKLSQQFLFNLYEIDDNFDVFVAFETMNNRGKSLSDLELLKNRLIYLTTLYPTEDVEDDVKTNIRNKINKAWGEIYNQLGRNKKHPLNDDDFLRGHWIMYFKYSRQKGDDYIRYLLDEYFSPKKVFEKLEVSTKKLDLIEEMIDSPEMEDEESDNEELEKITRIQSKLTIKDISDYVDSLKVASKVWHGTFFPSDTTIFSEVEKLAMDRINRVKISYFRPLIMAVVINTKTNDKERLEFLNEVERFIFLGFRICRAQSNYKSSHYYRKARSVYKKDTSVTNIIEDLKDNLDFVFYEDIPDQFNIDYFKTFISKKFKTSNGSGFYGWNDLRYFLFEYEEHLKRSRGAEKFGWSNFVKSEKDKISIEHIYPQNADSPYWQSRFLDDDKNKFYRGSLGNLLPLSLSINSSLQNDDFPDKKKTKENDDGVTVRHGYSDGSYSELEVAKEDNWLPENIEKRGLRLLKFMEERWNINLGPKEDKLELLHLDFSKKDEKVK